MPDLSDINGLTFRTFFYKTGTYKNVRYWRCDNCGETVIEYNGNFSVFVVNNCTHLLRFSNWGLYIETYQFHNLT